MVIIICSCIFFTLSSCSGILSSEKPRHHNIFPDNALPRLINLENQTSDGTIISSYTYTLDASGNRAKAVEHTSRTVEYTYDDTYKLLEEKITNTDSNTSVISYTCDAVGNRLTKRENGFPRSINMMTITA